MIAWEFQEGAGLRVYIPFKGTRKSILRSCPRYNILAICHWGLNEGLVKAYVIPYLRMIASASPSSLLFLASEEKHSRNYFNWPKELPLSMVPRLVAVPFIYRKFGPVKIFFQLIKVFRLLSLIRKQRIGVIHTFCSPSGVEGFILKKLTSCKLVIDSYEPHSEYMREGGVWSGSGIAYKLLKFFELQQVLVADALVVASRYAPDFFMKVHRRPLGPHLLKPACVDTGVFTYDQEFRNSYRSKMGHQQKIVGIYVGKIGDFYLSDEIFEYIRCAIDFWGADFHFIFLSPGYEEIIEKSLFRLKIPIDYVTITSARHESVAKYLSAADFAFSGYKPGPSKRCCTPIKNGEYWSIGLPVVIPSDISVDSDIIERDGIGYVLRSLDHREYYNSFIILNSLLSCDGNVRRMKIHNVARRERGFHLAYSVYSSIYPSIFESS